MTAQTRVTCFSQQGKKDTTERQQQQQQQYQQVVHQLFFLFIQYNMLNRITQYLYFMLLVASTRGFAPTRSLLQHHHHHQQQQQPPTTPTALYTTDLDVIALVAGQENYGLAAVCLGEGIWSFAQAPSLSHAKVLLPAVVATALLVGVSGPMITTTSGDASTVATGLWLATAVSTGLGVSYVLRLLAPVSPSPKEVAALGLLVAVAGFVSFAQNLVVNGFVTLPSIPIPALPSLGF